MLSHSAHLKDINELPEQGWSKEEILEQTKIYLGLGEFDWRQGTQSGTVYNGNKFLLTQNLKLLGCQTSGETLSVSV